MIRLLWLSTVLYALCSTFAHDLKPSCFMTPTHFGYLSAPSCQSSRPVRPNDKVLSFRQVGTYHSTIPLYFSKRQKGVACTVLYGRQPHNLSLHLSFSGVPLGIFPWLGGLWIRDRGSWGTLLSTPLVCRLFCTGLRVDWFRGRIGFGIDWLWNRIGCGYRMGLSHCYCCFWYTLDFCGFVVFCFGKVQMLVAWIWMRIVIRSLADAICIP
ncbi:hypothetical protein BDV97DRAFT_113827 [Delphinella strobiligena]|nr:hypothetical protein BDV97DRAFT_113827 [Delphinella strobiligena]